MNNNGPSRDPWGIPDKKSLHLEDFQLMTTLCFLSFKKLFNHFNTFQLFHTFLISLLDVYEERYRKPF